jgi:ABC-type glycerol-3-phosphate transport system substrate-binding protein
VRYTTRKRGPRRLRVVVAATVASALVVGAVIGNPAGASRARAASGGSLNVEVWNNWAFMKPAARQFEKANPGVRINIEGSVSSQQYFNNLPRTLVASGAPDVTALQVIPGPFDSILKSKELVNINDVWNEEKLQKAYPASTIGSYTAPNGGHYAINVDTFWTPIVWYNKTAFAKAHITAPKNGRVPSQAALYNMSTALAHAGYVPMALETTDDNGPAFLFGTLLESACGPVGFKNLEANWRRSVPVKTSWTAPCVLKALSALDAYGSHGVFGQTYTTENTAEADALFVNGRAGMLVTGSWGAAQFASSHVKFPFGWLIPPPVTGGAPSEMMGATLDGLGIDSKSPNVALAKRFLAFIASRQFNAQASVQGQLPGVEPRTDVRITSALPEASSQQLKATQTLGEGNLLTAAVPWEASINQLLINMLAGQKTVQQTASQLAGFNRQARSNPNA